jgi:HEPN domain-containing protein
LKEDYKILIEISKEDFEASKLLYENCFYPQSLFYFQQSIEKLIKYLGLKCELIKEHDLKRKIGHDSNLIFKEAITKYQNLNISNFDLDINMKFQKLNESMENLSNDKILEIIITNIFNTLENKPELPFDIEKIKTFEDLYQVLKKLNPDDPGLEELRLINNDKLFNSITAKMLQEFKLGFNDYIQGVIILFYLNTISQRLVSAVRYPEFDPMINPSQKYNKEHSLVKELPTLFKGLEYSLATIRMKD